MSHHVGWRPAAASRLPGINLPTLPRTPFGRNVRADYSSRWITGPLAFPSTWLCPPRHRTFLGRPPRVFSRLATTRDPVPNRMRRCTGVRKLHKSTLVYSIGVTIGLRSPEALMYGKPETRINHRIERRERSLPSSYGRDGLLETV